MGYGVAWKGRGGKMELEMFEEIRPDFECTACGHEVWGKKEPVRCLKCGGLIFEKVGKPADGKPDERLISGIERIRNDAQDILRSLRRDKGGKMAKTIREIAEAADNALRLATAERTKYERSR